MPPKRATTSKRKAKTPSDDEDEDEPLSGSDADSSQEERVVKKRKTTASKAKATAGKGKGAAAKGSAKAKASASQSQNGAQARANDGPAQPTNKVLPAQITFPEKGEDTVRVAAWNICGLAAAQKKGFKYYVEAEDADILILTETKVNNPPADPELTNRYPHRYWAISDKKTYAGTAILSKVKPLSVTYDLPDHLDKSAVKGRIVTLEFESCYVIGTYVTNAGTGLKTLDAKKEWNEHFEVYIRDLDRKKPVIWAGDLNVAPTALDLANPKTNWNKTPGYTEAETSSFARILNAEGEDADARKFVDVWRQRHPDLRHYTYFSYRFNCREKGLGWRLDMFVVSERLEERVRMCEIRSEIYGASDHCPIVLELAGAV
ncbi:Endonuclease/exonuclease/phosphatase [Ganoderma leucocontextum]|nr:Endonuclease/exonuclease/phosphatase [Ganoderma leucocontextum]